MVSSTQRHNPEETAVCFNMKKATKEILKLIAVLGLILFLLPSAMIRMVFLYGDTYPFSFRDARITKAIHLQAERGEVNLSAATPFTWDTVYYINDIPMEDDINSIQARLHVNLNTLRRVRIGKFDLPMGHCFIFIKDGKFVADLLMPASFAWNIPTKPVDDDWQCFGYAVLPVTEARFVPDEHGHFHLIGDAA